MGLLDVYPEGQSRAEAAKILLQQFLIDYDRPLSHPLMVDHLLSIARILHDTLKYHLTDTRLYRLVKLNVLNFVSSATSVEDEKRQISELAIALIDRVDFGRDFQQMLSFYGDARAAFTNLDPVLAHLVQVYIRSLPYYDLRTRHVTVRVCPL